MGQRYLIDSNVIIDYTGNRLPENGSNFVENLFNVDFLVSVVVKIEVLGFDGLPEKVSDLEAFLSTASVIGLEESITQQTILLKRKYRKLKLGDAIIAATAVVNNYVLVTRNIDDFKNIDGLEILNPWTDMG